MAERPVDFPGTIEVAPGIRIPVDQLANWQKCLEVGDDTITELVEFATENAEQAALEADALTDDECKCVTFEFLAHVQHNLAAMLLGASARNMEKAGAVNQEKALAAFYTAHSSEVLH